MKKNGIVFDIKKTNNLLLKALSERYKEMMIDITPIQSKVLMTIYESKEEVTGAYIEKKVHCNKSSMSSILNSLEKKGYITKTGDKKDTRKKIIKLTNRALSLIRILERDAKKVENNLMIGITIDEYEAFKWVLDKIEMNIERMKR